MPLSAPDRIDQQRQTSRIVALWRALQPLRSVVQFLNTGAHPDDETSAMLAALIFRDGINIAYACANRGEGGQNDCGGEVTEDLGTIRTAEMERAADLLDMRLYWLSQSPGDTLFDFGFSKSGTETMEKWCKARTLKRFVDIVRAEKPDIICPTFLDIPGQHGHHRAMTLAAHIVMDLAADPSYTDSDLPAWTVSKLYLPAWSGAGGAYDDEVPPPPATVTVNGQGVEEVTGWSWEQIGQHARWFHKTQGMGHWCAPGTERDWPLHLAQSRVGDDDGSIADNLPQTLTDLDSGNALLAKAQSAIDAAIAAFPHRVGIMEAAQTAHGALSDIEQDVPYAHRVVHKRDQLALVIRLASGANVRAYVARDRLLPGETTDLTVERREPDTQTMTVTVEPGHSCTSDDKTFLVHADAEPSDAYPDAHDPLRPVTPRLAIRIGKSTSYLPLEVPPLILPKVVAGLSRTKALLNTRAKARSMTVALSGTSGGTPTFKLPPGWSQTWDGTSATIVAPDELTAGLYDLPLMLDGVAAQTVNHLSYPHIQPRLRSFPASLSIRSVDVTVPEGVVGYIGAGKDNAASWLRMLGFKVRELDPADLAGPGALDGLDSLLIGVFAFRFRDDLHDHLADIHAWVRAGGNLVTLYHRPWDRWAPETTPLAPLEIGQPSLRWRVTDENAAVTHLVPDHPLLRTPNAITDADWADWHKERGLYFAKNWDPAYTPLLSMADTGEEPHQGALLSGTFGRGRHTHCCLILHHQMEKLTPGAFRLMANLLAGPLSPAT
ncbi:MAG: PIG-L family deacetylase [Pseudomonadota bacterium]